MSYSIVQAAAGVGNTTLGCAGLGCGVIPGVPFAGLGAAVLNPYARGVAVNTRVTATDPKLSLVGRLTSGLSPSVSNLYAEATPVVAAEDDTLFYVGVAVAAAALLGGVWYFTR